MKQLQLRMRPLEQGRRTEVSLCTSFPSRVPSGAMREVISALAVLSDHPVSIVLLVDGHAQDWCDVWSRNLRAVGHHSIEVRFELDEEQPS